MRIVVFGSGGKVGRLLVPLLVQAGHDVVGVIHREASADVVRSAGAQPVVVDLEGDAGPVREVLVGADAAVWWWHVRRLRVADRGHWSTGSHLGTGRRGTRSR